MFLGRLNPLLVVLVCVFAVVLYTRTSSVKATWSPVTTDVNGNAVVIDHYEVELIRDVSGETFTYGTSATNISIPRPKSGKYMIRVRAVAKNPDGTSNPSGWCESINAACSILMDGTAGEWKVNFKPSAPLGPIIIN